MSYRDAHMARQLRAAFVEQRNHDEVAHERLAEIRALLKCAEGEEVQTLRDLLTSVGGGR